MTNNQNTENAVTDSHPHENAVTDNQKPATKTVKLLVTDIGWLNDKKSDDETFADALSRIREELDRLHEERNKHYEVVALKDSQLEDLHGRISNLESELEDLQDSRSTALTPADQTSLGDFSGDVIKNTVDDIKDMCDDETVCIKTAMHMLDTKAAMVSKDIDRTHSSEEKDKDRTFSREEKDKDRELKQDLEEKRMQHQKDLALIRKGIVSKDDLEDVVFLGSMHTKSAKERLEEKKRQAYVESDEDEDLPSMTEGFIGEGEEDL